MGGHRRRLSCASHTPEHGPEPLSPARGTLMCIGIGELALARSSRIQSNGGKRGSWRPSAPPLQNPRQPSSPSPSPLHRADSRPAHMLICSSTPPPDPSSPTDAQPGSPAPRPRLRPLRPRLLRTPHRLRFRRRPALIRHGGHPRFRRDRGSQHRRSALGAGGGRAGGGGAGGVPSGRFGRSLPEWGDLGDGDEQGIGLPAGVHAPRPQKPFELYAEMAQSKTVAWRDRFDWDALG